MAEVGQRLLQPGDGQALVVTLDGGQALGHLLQQVVVGQPVGVDRPRPRIDLGAGGVEFAVFAIEQGAQLPDGRDLALLVVLEVGLGLVPIS
ncbi:MAG TPA: hypothetical protein VIU11_03510 [Nakamurella sp.]